MQPSKEQALVDTGRWLLDAGYEFVAITPESHRRVLLRRDPPCVDIRAVFGWSRSFGAGVLPDSTFESLAAGGWLERVGGDAEGLWKSRVRYSTLDGGIYAHSAYPTIEEDSVFFGPDTYRFCSWLARSIGRGSRVVDIGCGSGAGALSLRSKVDRLVLADINEYALSFARVNSVLAGVASRVETVCSDVFESVRGEFDIAIANPPYLVDAQHRTYRDGGGTLGYELALKIVEQGLQRVQPGGRVLLYTGAPVVGGVDLLKAALSSLVSRDGVSWTYEELDPDVFGEELSNEAYAAVDRIAAVGATFCKA